jgi:predicted flap endonuclease-1-like 5' DNA nuclease
MKKFLSLIAIVGVIATAACSSKKTETVPAEELRAEQTVEPTFLEEPATQDNVQNVAGLGASSSGRSR